MPSPEDWCNATWRESLAKLRVEYMSKYSRDQFGNLEVGERWGDEEPSPEDWYFCKEI